MSFLLLPGWDRAHGMQPTTLCCCYCLVFFFSPLGNSVAARFPPSQSLLLAACCSPQFIRPPRWTSRRNSWRRKGIAWLSLHHPLHLQSYALRKEKRPCLSDGGVKHPEHHVSMAKKVVGGLPPATAYTIGSSRLHFFFPPFFFFLFSKHFFFFVLFRPFGMWIYQRTWTLYYASRKKKKIHTHEQCQWHSYTCLC